MLACNVGFHDIPLVFVVDSSYIATLHFNLIFVSVGKWCPPLFVHPGHSSSLHIYNIYYLASIYVTRVLPYC